MDPRIPTMSYSQIKHKAQTKWAESALEISDCDIGLPPNIFPIRQKKCTPWPRCIKDNLTRGQGKGNDFEPIIVIIPNSQL